MSLMNGLVLDQYDREKLAEEALPLARKFAKRHARPGIPFRDEEEIESLALVSIATAVASWMPDVIPWKTCVWKKMKQDFVQEHVNRRVWMQKRRRSNGGNEETAEFSKCRSDRESDPRKIVEAKDYFEAVISGMTAKPQHFLREVILKSVPANIAAAKMRISDAAAYEYLKDFRIRAVGHYTIRRMGRERARSLFASRNPHTLTMDDARKIRHGYHELGKSRQELSWEFGVDISTIRRVVLNQIWKNDSSATAA